MPPVLLVAAMICARNVLAEMGGLRGTPANGTVLKQNPTQVEQNGMQGKVLDGNTSETQAASWNASSEVLNPDSYVAQAAGVGHRRRSHIKTVYHQTSSEIASLILADGFKLGHGGWCGGGIYFAMTPEATNTKAIAPSSHTGVVIEATVDIGHSWHKDKACDRHLTAAALHALEYDSVTFNPGDGDEYVLYSSDRVLSTKLYGLRTR